MKNENCDRKSKCDDYKYNHCDGCGANKPIGDSISRSVLTKELRERLVACNDWEEQAKDKETRIRANAVKTFICEMFMLLKEIPTVEPERTQGKSISLEDGLKKARRGNYVIYDVDFLLDHLAREVNIMESARRLKAEKGNDNE
jgi:hypothetical protein